MTISIGTDNLDLQGLHDGLMDLAAGALKGANAIIPLPPAPLPRPIAFGEAVTVPAGGSGTINLLENDQPGDPDRPITSYEILASPTKVAVTINEQGILSWRGAVDQQAGSDELRYRVLDAEGIASDLAVVAFTLLAPPVVSPPPPPSPPPPTTPPVLAKAIGYHPGHGQNQGVPVDTAASWRTIVAALGTGRYVGLWPLMNRHNLLRAGRGMPANIYQWCTDQDLTAVLTLPILFRDPQDNAGKGGPGDWDNLMQGCNDQWILDHLGWAERQGQGSMLVRMGHEQGAENWFPHCIGAGWDDNLDITPEHFAKVRAGTNRMMKLVKTNFPRMTIVYSHFKEPHYYRGRGASRTKIYVHPSQFRPTEHHVEDLDYYDGGGQPYSAANADQLDNNTRAIPGFTERAPQGVLAWQKWIRAQGKPFGGLSEMGISCDGTDPARDNAFYMKHVFDLFKANNWWWMLAFNTYDRKPDGLHQLFPTTKAGTRRATDEWIRQVRALAA